MSQLITLLNPEMFQWNISYIGEYYKADGYATRPNASIALKEPFLTIVGSVVEKKPTIATSSTLYSLISCKERLNENPFADSRIIFYGTREDPEELSKKVGIPILSKMAYLESQDRENLNFNLQHYVLAFPMKGYIQPIPPSWEYKIYQGSLLHLNEHTPEGFPKSVLYMALDTYCEIPPLVSINLEDAEYDEPSLVKITCSHARITDYHNPEGFNLSHYQYTKICSAEYFQENKELKFLISKRKTIFPIAK